MSETTEDFLKRVAADTKRRGGVMFEGKDASARLLELATRSAKIPDENETGYEAALGTEFLKQLYDGIVTDGPCISFRTLEGNTPNITGMITAFGLGDTIMRTFRAMIQTALKDTDNA